MIIGITGKISSGKDTAGQMIRWIQSSHLRKLWEDDLEHFITRGYLFNHETNWEIKKWADTLKDITCMILGCTREEIEDREWKEKPLGDEWDCWVNNSHKTINPPRLSLEKPSDFFNDSGGVSKRKITPRLMLQLLGTEAGRQIIHPNIWVNALMSQYIGETVVTQITFPSSVNTWKESKMPNWIITDTRFPNEVEAIKQRKGIIINIQRPETDHLAGTHESETALDNYDYSPYVIINDGDMFHLVIKIEKLLKQLNLVTL
jgi:hypothetical protein